MKRIERNPVDRAVDDVVATAMAYCNAFRKMQAERAPVLWHKLMRATRRLEKRTGKS
jgi:hypothetical protein